VQLAVVQEVGELVVAEGAVIAGVAHLQPVALAVVAVHTLAHVRGEGAVGALEHPPETQNHHPRQTIHSAVYCIDASPKHINLNTLNLNFLFMNHVQLKLDNLNTI
jgi:hypothetical protein